MLLGVDDTELGDWLRAATVRGGGFLSSIATAGLVADYENYALMRPFLLQLKKKYPQYGRKDPREALNA